MMEEFSEVRSGSKVYWRRGHTDLTEPEKEGWIKKIEKKKHFAIEQKHSCSLKYN